MSVRFGTGSGIVASLEVEARPANGSVASLGGVAALLFSLRVQVLRVQQESGADASVSRFAVCEFDGGPLSPRRRRLIAASVEAAIAAPPSQRAA